MPSIPSNLSRVSNNLRTLVTSGNLSKTQAQLIKVQDQLSTGKRLNTPSDDPGSAAIIQSIRKSLEQRDGYLQNLKSATSQLGVVDSTLGDVTDLINEAQQLASANVGSDVTADARTAASSVVDRLYSQLFSLGNREFDGVYLFGGDRSTAPPFVEAGGGVKFVGTKDVLQNDYDEGTTLPFGTDGDAVFGALSTRVKGVETLAPGIQSDTRLEDLRGAVGEGVRLGQISLGNGTIAKTIDLRGANTVGDVVDAINAAGVGTITAAVATDGVSLELTGGAAENIAVNEVGGGTTAGDLGILQPTGAGAATPLDGNDLQATVTGFTRLADLNGGAGLDTAGLVVTNGLISKTIDLSSAVTVGDLLNAVNSSGTNVLAEINENGSGINLLNPTQGISLTIGENGGATATQLGLRSFNAGSPLSELNFGKGLRLVAGGDDFTITDSDGVNFGVDLDGATTIQDVLSRINTAATTAGAGITASLVATGNGLLLTDSAGGAGTLAIANTPFSKAVDDLGLAAPAAGTTIIGSDINAVQSQGMFANMLALRNALTANDQGGITRAAENLKRDYDRIVRLHGDTGARVKELEARQARLEDQNVATAKVLSEVEDVDFTEAITRFQTLQTALQASLKAAGATLNLSLLDFLR